MAKKKYPRFSLSKKSPQTPTLFPPIVNQKNPCDNLFNISNKYIRENANNGKLIIQKRDAKTYYINYKNYVIYITRILREVSKTTKILENLVNDLRPEFSFGSVINSLSSSRFISYTQPNTYSGKKSEDDSLYRHILELPSPDGLGGNDDLDQVEELELSHYTDSQKHKIFDVTKPYSKVTPCCHKSSSREFLRGSV